MDSILQSAYAKMANMDPPRRAPRVRVRVVSKTDGHVIAGHVLTRGENVIEVYEDEVQRIEAQIEDIAPHQLRVAREKFERALAAWEEKKNPPETAPFSLEMFIRDVTGRDPKPLASAEVLGPVEKPSKRKKNASDEPPGDEG